MKAREIMTSNPECLTEDDTVENAARRMRELNVGIIPVVDDSNSMRLLGVITDRDIAVRHVADGHEGGCTVRDHMSSDLDTVGPDEDVDRVMEHMRARQVRRIPVVEDGDRIVGIIAQADLAVETGREKAEEVERTVEEISEPARPNR